MITTAKRRSNGSAAKRRGAELEKHTLAKLRGMGCYVEIIATPTIFVGGKVRRTAKVFADIIGLNAAGRGLLVECKNYGRRPRPSDFLPHQRETLLEWSRRGGVAMVAWIADGQWQIVQAEAILCKPVRKATHADEYEPTREHRRG